MLYRVCSLAASARLTCGRGLAAVASQGIPRMKGFGSGERFVKGHAKDQTPGPGAYDPRMDVGFRADPRSGFLTGDRFAASGDSLEGAHAGLSLTCGFYPEAVPHLCACINDAAVGRCCQATSRLSMIGSRRCELAVKSLLFEQ
jgi:hypothetical protein